MEDENEIEVENIDDIIKDEFEQAENAETFKQSPESKRQSEASNKIAVAIFDAIKCDSNSYYFGTRKQNLLIKLINRAKLNNFSASVTFWIIEGKLNTELTKIENTEANKREISFLENALRSLDFVAVRYFEEYLVEEFKSVHIAEILIRTKNTLVKIGEDDEKYFRKALLNVQKDVEQRIEFRKEEKLIREQIYEPNNSDENFGVTDKKERKRDLTLDRSVLFIDYILRYLKTSCQNTDKAKVISFLTGYSEQKIAQAFSRLEKEKLEMKERTELSEKFSKDIEIVCKYLQILQLNEIENLMYKDLELDFD